MKERSFEAERRGFDVVGVGLAARDNFRVVESYPENDTKCHTVDAVEMGGGPVATALVTLSRLGRRTALVSCVGTDAAGDEIVRELAGEEVDVSSLHQRPAFTTPSPVIVVERPTGKRTVFEWHLPYGPLRPVDLDTRMLRNTRALLCDGRCPRADLEAARIVRENGGFVLLDCGHARPGIRDLAREADAFIASHSFLRTWGEGAGTEKGLAELAGWGPRIFGFTLGVSGSVVSWEGRIHRTPGFRVEAVDTTGAGDVFHGAFLFGVLEGWGPGRTLRFANAAAALSARKLGGRGALPGLGEIESLLEREPA